MNEKFIEELDDITQKQWKNIYVHLKAIESEIMGIKILVEPKQILNLLEKYDLDPKIEFIMENELGNDRMKYYYNGQEIKPNGRYIGVERDATLLEILTECTIQQKNDPDIKHLQVNSLQNKRGDKLEKILKNNVNKSN